MLNSSDNSLSFKLFTTFDVPNTVKRLAEVGAVLEDALGKFPLDLWDGLSETECWWWGLCFWKRGGILVTSLSGNCFSLQFEEGL